jgi:hypothetical protein
MSLFLILVNYIAALVSVQLLRGDITADQATNFGQLYTAFLAIWQIFSSENWTTVLYVAMTAETGLGQVVIVAIFLTCWLLFANCEWSSNLLYSVRALNPCRVSHHLADVHRRHQREF